MVFSCILRNHWVHFLLSPRILSDFLLVNRNSFSSTFRILMERSLYLSGSLGIFLLSNSNLLKTLNLPIRILRELYISFPTEAMVNFFFTIRNPREISLYQAESSEYFFLPTVIPPGNSSFPFGILGELDFTHRNPLGKFYL
jgi:hypothetical protein